VADLLAALDVFRRSLFEDGVRIRKGWKQSTAAAECPHQPTVDAVPAEVPAMRPNTDPAIKPVPPG
jgi:hypothetical protein